MVVALVDVQTVFRPGYKPVTASAVRISVIINNFNLSLIMLLRRYLNYFVIGSSLSLRTCTCC